MKKILALLLIAGVGLFVARKTHFGSYASTCVAQVGDEVRRQIPTKFELERIRHEIASLDRDISRMVRPVAEYKTEIDHLRKDVDKRQTQIEEQRKVLLSMTEDLKTNPVSLTYADREYPASVIRRKLQKDFDGFKRQEAQVKALRQTLEAKEASLRASQDQLVKVIEKKREYELRVAQLEAENETLQVARIGNHKLQLDDSRATQIEQSLAAVQKQLDSDRNELELQSGNVVTDNIPVQQRAVDLSAIRAYLRQETAEQTETAQGQK